jgi:hypothetical protein
MICPNPGETQQLQQPYARGLAKRRCEPDPIRADWGTAMQ